ncbi:MULTISPECIES: sensor histidine kinase [Methanobacterium]|jgi:PAS domain S-box-containing protein|uniref:PAS domain S-box protein n=3 Tax=Methanobacterium formicicum TaxID=2162 RepID=A0A089ZIH0_METFO|nr:MULTISPECIES: histidine kinase dimerization/phosphoacceptor domain -containing protein [Methanobacterium]AIS32448.1 signal transduction histidine kinase [Methanobacterium formicicum]AXV39523.1 MAG: histidine kinase [Methanobacterium sp. BAmetb5]KUK73963.1 MAG: Signal transduction histidine kinase [Methanobacterium sp. 42_16]MBF4474118.1 PAS domain S-box protein [Methanobacterium formicicum]MDD4809736.1 histidine kinase dimerization/phosphoacceptor domain -containing protein [Methanobacteriu
MRSDSDDNWDSIREKIIGLGEQSIRKSYYPELQQRLSELERFRALLDETNEAIFLCEVPSGRFADVNKSACQQLGYSSSQMLGMRVDDIIAPDKMEEMRTIIFSLFDGKHLQNRKTIETVLMGGDSSQTNVEMSISLVRFGDAFYTVMVAHDITERKIFEDALKSSLQEKEVLIKEIHHRVKNNMQIISSLLNLQKQYVNDEEAVNVLKESQNRVKSMAMIHEKLYKSRNFSEINFADYIRSLVSDLFYSYGVDSNRIRTIIVLDEVMMGLETAIPCGLIVSELVTNTLKYAFPHQEEGEFRIELHAYEDGFYELIISDNGVGIPENFDLDETETLGLQLVKSLVNQLEGTVELIREGGTMFKIKFKELEYKERI